MLSDTIEVNVEYGDNGKPCAILVGYQGEYSEYPIKPDDPNWADAEAIKEVQSWLNWIFEGDDC